MSSLSAADLEALLAPLPEPIGQLTHRVVEFLQASPGLSGRVRFGWRSVNFRHEAAGHVCAVFPHADRVSVYFEHGRLLADPDGVLMGEGLKKGRFLRLFPDAAFPEGALAVLVAEAIALFA